MGMVKKSITITEQQEKWIQSLLAKGQYASDSEIMREALRERSCVPPSWRPCARG